ncbi:MAG: S8 family serine peptidase, partial [Myxococcales bacterium]|nr:S8 family serine peptidase [Polyangiaceae bacterium]MDW8249037.1 S8 family serine peptidase [Myxococcales bacterium]
MTTQKIHAALGAILVLTNVACAGGELLIPGGASETDLGGSGGSSAGAGGTTAGAGGTTTGTGGNEAGAAGSAGSSGDAGAAGQSSDTGDRGDPANFPEICAEDCAAACTRLLACGGSQSKTFPLEAQECIDRCKLADNGPQGLWKDQSKNFRCCVAQEDCAAVKNCGGWLRHPDVVKPCDRVCECVFGGSTLATHGFRQLAPPPGYVWSKDTLVVESTGQSLDLGFAGTATVEEFGRFQVIRFRTPPSESLRRHMNEALRVLPTFQDGGGRLAAATGAIHVRWKKKAARAKVEALLAARGLSPLIPVFPGSRVLRSVGDPWEVLAVVHELKAQEGVEAELDMLRTYERRSLPNDPHFPDQWHLKNTGQKGATVGIDGRVDEAWDVTLGDPQVIVAINDDGVDLNHPDLKDNLVGALNFPQDWESRLLIGTFGGHGTPCAGVAAARGENGLGGSGVCPRCRILPHLLGETQGISFAVTDEDVAKGFVAMVDARAWVISNSWGPSTGDPNFDGNALVPALSPVIQEAFDYAETKGRGGKGTVILFAAGNSNAPLDNYRSYAPTQEYRVMSGCYPTMASPKDK